MRLASAALPIALAAALSGCRREPPKAAPPPVAAATVNGVAIPVPAVQRELDRLRRAKSGEPPAAVDPREVPQVAKALLGPLIDRALLVQRAREAGLSVSDADVQREFDRRSETYAQAGQTLDDRLKQDGLTADDLAAEIRESLLAERFVGQQLGPPAAVTKEEVRAFYDEHRADYDQPEMVHAHQIVVASAEEAKSLLDQLRAGAAFDELARKHSQSPDAKRGGDLGFFARGTMPKVFDEACFSLRSGAISGVVPSPYGYHLFRVTERRSARRRAFDDVKAEIERRILADRRAMAERKLLDELRAAATVQVNEAQLSSLR